MVYPGFIVKYSCSVCSVGSIVLVGVVYPGFIVKYSCSVCSVGF